MKKKIRKKRPEPPWYFYFDTDNCYCCKNKNGCGGCKFLKKYIHTKQKINKGSHSFRALLYAGVAEQADARDLKSLDGNIIRVRFPSPAPFIIIKE